MESEACTSRRRKFLPTTFWPPWSTSLHKNLRRLSHGILEDSISGETPVNPERSTAKGELYLSKPGTRHSFCVARGSSPIPPLLLISFPGPGKRGRAESGGRAVQN